VNYFPNEKEGAFGNIILQNGAFTSIGFVLSFYVPCTKRNTYCIDFKEGDVHNTLVLEIAIIAAAVFAIIGYLRASNLYSPPQEQQQHHGKIDNELRTLMNTGTNHLPMNTSTFIEERSLEGNFETENQFDTTLLVSGGDGEKT